MPDTPDFEQALVCWDCGTPLIMHADGAEKPCGHTGTAVVTRAVYRRQKGQPAAIDECPRSPDGRHHWENVTRHQDTIERRVCAYCSAGFEDAPVMPGGQSPDFEKIAFDIVQRIWGNTELDQPGLIIETRAVAEQLRQVWNARGEADMRELAEPVSAIVDAIRGLDR